MDAESPLSEEQKRLNALKAYDILDTPAEEAFDELVHLAASLCSAPIAFISLVDEHRQWFKAKFGFDINETSREFSFCTHTVKQKDLLIVSDTFADSRFSSSPLVLTEPSIRFYAGAPLITPDGQAIGALCIVDHKPRQLSKQHKQALHVLSRHVMVQFELRRRIADLTQANLERDNAISDLKAAHDKLDFLVGEQEVKIARLRRIHTLLSSIDSVISRVRDRQQLLWDVCRIAVEQGKFLMAWVALVDSDTLEGKPVAWMGADEKYIEQIYISSDPEVAKRPANQAVRTAKTVISNDIAKDPNMAMLKEDPLTRGYRSMIALPLLEKNYPIGVIAFYGSECDFFDEEEVPLLQDLASNISFALEHITKDEQLDYLTSYSIPTGLANRALCLERLNSFILDLNEHQNMFALVVIDFERFRIINEMLGRQVGDDLLILFAERLITIVEDPDYIAHLGADSFVIFLTDINDATDVIHILEKELINSLNRPFLLNGQELRLAIKAGISLHPTDGDNAETLLSHAEIALKKAKASGERYSFYSKEINTRIAEALTFENKLRRAIDDQQFVLYYQPKVSLRNGKIEGLEALLRWNDPDMGLVMPYQFIPLLEETGLILEVGKWIMKQAVDDYRYWVAKDLNPPRIAVNVSPLQLKQKDFVNQVEMAIGENDPMAGGLDIEITETVLMEQMEQSIEKLTILKKMGIQIAIDDFGTGYSSLRYIARLPIDTLKVDRLFVEAMTQNADDMAIVSTIISLAHGLNLKVVAEGVETEEQRNLLRLLRCEQMQGFLFSEPLEKDKITQMLFDKKSKV